MELDFFVGNKYKSGPVHEVVVNVTIESFIVAIPGSKAQRHETEFDVMQPDAVIHFPHRCGLIAIVQAVCSPNYSRESLIIKRLSKITDINFIVIVCANNDIKLAMNKELKKQFEGKVPIKVSVTNVEEIFSPEFDWQKRLGINNKHINNSHGRMDFLCRL